MVTLLNITVLGLQGRFGAITASSDVKPSLLLVRLLQKAASAAEPRGPMIRSMCATSLPSPTSDSPTRTLSILAIAGILPKLKTRLSRGRSSTSDAGLDRAELSLIQRTETVVSGPVGRIAAGLAPPVDSPQSRDKTSLFMPSISFLSSD